jgi:hypothetical protein
MSLQYAFFVYFVVQSGHVINDCFLASLLPTPPLLPTPRPAPVLSPIEYSKYFLLRRDDCITFLCHLMLASGDRLNDSDDYCAHIQLSKTCQGGKIPVLTRTIHGHLSSATTVVRWSFVASILLERTLQQKRTTFAAVCRLQAVLVGTEYTTVKYGKERTSTDCKGHKGSINWCTSEATTTKRKGTKPMWTMRTLKRMVTRPGRNIRKAADACTRSKDISSRKRRRT